jgi:hypothetical protein
MPLLHHTNSMDGGVTSAIQLALTPAFLLTGISSLLNVMTGRLSRIVERGRLLHGSSRHGCHDEFGVELRHLERRLRLTSRAIYATTLAALLVCAILPALFLGGLLKTEFTWVVGGLFFGATGALVIGLGDFLREVHLATKTVRFTAENFTAQNPTAQDSAAQNFAAHSIPVPQPTEPAQPVTDQRG